MSLQNLNNQQILENNDDNKKNEELNSKFSVFLNKKEKQSIQTSPSENTPNSANEQNEIPGVEINTKDVSYGRSYLQKMKASSQRKYIKDEKHPRMFMPPLPDSSRSKQNIYNDFRKKKELIEKEKENLDLGQSGNGKDLLKTFSAKESLGNLNANEIPEQSVNEFAFSLRNKKLKTKTEGKIYFKYLKFLSFLTFFYNCSSNLF